MSLAIGDVFEVSCDECGATLQYRVDAQTLATFIGAPSSPVNLRLINRQPGATFGGCPHERDDCAGATAALARLHEIPGTPSGGSSRTWRSGTTDSTGATDLPSRQGASPPTAVPTGRSGHSRIGLVTAQPDIVMSGPG